MNYSELERLAGNWNGKVCIFGAGMVGRTWAYELLVALGFRVDFYCDNHLEEGRIIRDDVKTISFATLKKRKDGVLVFIAKGFGADEIEGQLEENHFPHYYTFDWLFFSRLMEDLSNTANPDVKRRYIRFIDDKKFLEYKFEKKVGYPLDLDRPRTFNEKLQWLKLYNRNPLYTRLVDKYELKRQVSAVLGEQYIIPVLGVWDAYDEIDFGSLPEQFVMKCTHDSGSVVIVKGKKDFNPDDYRKYFSDRLKTNYFWLSREWPYKDVPPRIMAEPYLENGGEEGLNDYKLFCFDGEVKLVQVDYSRFTAHKRNVYDLEWNYLPVTIKYPTDEKIKIPKPDCLEEMVYIASTLSKNIPHVRVDFYIYKEKPYVGEMTFYHGGGYERFNPKEWDYRLGEYLECGRGKGV